MTSSLITLFSTLAQVSFTVSGLMAVAIAGDSKRRDYWFGNESRSLFVYITFLLLLLPGFFSIGGLIPTPSNLNIPSWTYTSLSLGILYLLLFITYFFRKKKLAEPEEFERLETKFFKVIWELGTYGIGMVLLGGFGYSTFYTSSVHNYDLLKIGVGIMLLLLTMIGALNSVILLRENNLPIQISEKINSLTPLEQIGNSNQKKNSNSNIYTVLIISIFAFVIGLFINQKSKLK